MQLHILFVRTSFPFCWFFCFVLLCFSCFFFVFFYSGTFYVIEIAGNLWESCSKSTQAYIYCSGTEMMKKNHWGIRPDVTDQRKALIKMTRRNPEMAQEETRLLSKDTPAVQQYPTPDTHIYITRPYVSLLADSPIFPVNFSHPRGQTRYRILVLVQKGFF